MKQNLAIGLAVVAMVIAISPYVGKLFSGDEFGGTRYPNGLSADTTLPVAGEVRGTNLTITNDALVSGRTLNVTTSNTSTSTISGGCFQFTATSTATPHKFQASTTPGLMVSEYGTCPNL